MVLLIGGTGSSGKTSLSNILMKKLLIPYFSIDYLMMGIFRSNSNCGFTPKSDTQTINKIIWPIVLEMIKTNIENDHSIIFEGFQILPKNGTEIPNEYKSNVKAIFLSLSCDYIKSHYSEIQKSRSIIENRNDVTDLELMIAENEELIKECKKYNQDCRVICEDYEKEMELVIEEIASNNKFKRIKLRFTA